MLLQDEPAQRHLDRRGEARREEVGREFGVHRQRLVEGARRQLDAVLVRDRLRRRRSLRREDLCRVGLLISSKVKVITSKFQFTACSSK